MAVYIIPKHLITKSDITFPAIEFIISCIVFKVCMPRSKNSAFKSVTRILEQTMDVLNKKKGHTIINAKL